MLNAKGYSREQLRAVFDEVKPWYHYHVVDGVPAKTESLWGEPLDHPRDLAAALEPVLQDLEGKSVIDVGCNEAYFCFLASQRGAVRALGIDGDATYVARGALIGELLGAGGVELRCMSAYAIDESLGTFDLALLLGLIYHLKNPLLVLERVAAITTGTIVVETAIRNSSLDQRNRRNGVPGAPAMDFLEQPFVRTSPEAHLRLDYDGRVRYEGAPNWWLPNTECVAALLRTCGFASISVLQETFGPPDQSTPPFGRAIVVGRK